MFAQFTSKINLPKESAFMRCCTCVALVSCAVGIRGLPPEVRLHSSVTVKNAWSYTYTPPYPFTKKQLIPTDQETTSSRKAKDAQAQYLLVNDELLLSILKHSHSALAHCAPLQTLHVSGLCVVVWQSVVPTIVLSKASSPPPPMRHANHHQGPSNDLWCTLYICQLARGC
jgi:hypothetical protein